MKNTIKAFIALFMIAGLWSCENEDNFMIAEAQQADFAILTPDSGSSVIITEATPQTNSAATFTWEDVDYGTPTAVTYTVEFAANGTDFATPTEMTSSALQNFSITYAELNTAATNLSPVPLDPDAPQPVAIDVRIKSSVGTTGSEPLYSNVITISVTPFVPTVTTKRELYLVGSAVESGWNNNNNNTPMFRDALNDDLYTFTGYFLNDGTDGAGQFKVLEKKTLWQPQWGQNGGVLAVNDGTGSDPGPFTVATSGYYTVIINIAEMSFSIEPFTDVTATIPTVGIIGTSTAGAWDSSTPMTNSTFNPHIWKINVDLTAGEMKFRANNDWALAWGANTPISGIGSTDGGAPNVPVTAGSYDVWFNDLDGHYLMIPQD